MIYIYKLLSLDKSNFIKHLSGFIVNIFILIMLLGLILLTGGFSIYAIYYILIVFFKILISANVFYKIWILFFLIIWIRLRGNVDVAQEIDFKLKEYFRSKDQDGLNKYKMILMMLCIYISICSVGFYFYIFIGGKWSEDNMPNIINIFIWATYLIGPIVAIWVYSDWREPHKLNKKLELINEIEDQILGLERSSRELNELINNYLDRLDEPYSKLQLEYNQFTRKMANLEILSRQLEMNDELKQISKKLSSFNFSFVSFSLFPSALLSILKKENIQFCEENSKDKDFKDRISMLLRSDDREKWLSQSYGDIFEIQKELITLKREYIF